MAAFDWMSDSLKQSLEVIIAIVLALGIGIPMVMTCLDTLASCSLHLSVFSHLSAIHGMWPKAASSDFPDGRHPRPKSLFREQEAYCTTRMS